MNSEAKKSGEIWMFDADMDPCEAVKYHSFKGRGIKLIKGLMAIDAVSVLLGHPPCFLGGQNPRGYREHPFGEIRQSAWRLEPCMF